MVSRCYDVIVRLILVLQEVNYEVSRAGYEKSQGGTD